MKFQKDMTVYEELKQFYDRNPYGIYPYQDLDTSGLKELTYESDSESQTLKKWEKSNISKQLKDIITNIILKKYPLAKLYDFLEENPIIEYYDSYIDFFSEYLKCNKNLKLKTAHFIKELIKKTNENSIINFCIITSVCLEDEELNNIIKVFSVHNSYLFYYLAVLKYKNNNEEIFKICQNSEGHGRALGIMNLNVTDNNMRKWLIEDGLKNSMDMNIIFKYTILSYDFIEYINEEKYDAEAFEKVACYISIYLFEECEINELQNADIICSYIIDNVEKNFGGIYSLYCISSIMTSIEDILFYSGNHDYDERELDLYKKFLVRCRKICKIKRWHEVLNAEISNIDLKPDIIIECADRIKYNIKKSEFKSIFKRNNTLPAIYKYAFSSKNKALENFILDEGLKSLNMSLLLCGQDNIHLDSIQYSEIEHMCYFIIVSNVSYEGYEELYKKISIEALNSPIIETRMCALSNLMKIKDILDDYDKDEIIEIKNREVNAEIRNGIRILLGDKQYTSISHADVTRYMNIRPHVKDIYLKTVYLEGTEHIDFSSMEKDIILDEIVYILKDKGKNNFLSVSTIKGYIIGYLSSKSNMEIYNLCDKDKYLYAIIKEFNKNTCLMKIDIYLSYQDVIDEIESTLTLLTKRTGNKYVQ